MVSSHRAHWSFLDLVWRRDRRNAWNCRCDPSLHEHRTWIISIDLVIPSPNCQYQWVAHARLQELLQRWLLYQWLQKSLLCEISDAWKLLLASPTLERIFVFVGHSNHSNHPYISRTRSPMLFCRRAHEQATDLYTLHFGRYTSGLVGKLPSEEMSYSSSWLTHFPYRRIQTFLNAKAKAQLFQVVQGHVMY